MPLQALWELLERELFPIPSTDTLFNPYNGHDPQLDQPDGQEIRRRNLRSYLESFREAPPILMVGEAPGPWGCRFSGVPFTSEAQLCGGNLPFSGRQSSLATAPYRERSGQLLWELLLPHHHRFLLWNCVPFHPHHPGEPLSIRNPKVSEVTDNLELLQALLKIVTPERVIAIGRHSENALRRLGAPGQYVRHPSQGGATQFRTAIRAIFG